MTPGINYPNSLDDDSSLFVAVNNLRTTLTSDIDDSQLTIPVVTTAGFPNSGFITILSNPDDITQAEAIRYEGVTPTTFSGTERGAGGTAAFSHGAGTSVDLTVVADHHNVLKDAVIELEKFVGVSGSENFLPQDQFGNVTIQGDLTVVSGTFDNLAVQEPFTTSSGVFIDSLTVSGTPVVIGSPDITTDRTRGGIWIDASGADIIASLAPEIFIFVPRDSIIEGVNVVTAGGPGSCSVDVRKKLLSSGFPPDGTNSITNSNPITLNNQTFDSNINISQWDTSIAEGSILSLKLLSASNFTTIQVNITLQ